MPITETTYGADSLIGIQKSIAALIARQDAAQNRAERKVLAGQIAAKMSDYNEEVGFIAYDEGKYKS